MVTDASEWCTLKAVASLTTPLEAKMLWQQDQTGVRLYLQAKETVYVPFKLQRVYRHSLEHDLPISEKEPHTTSISFECNSSGVRTLVRTVVKHTSNATEQALILYASCNFALVCISGQYCSGEIRVVCGVVAR